jgi:TolB-like protein
MKNRFLCFAVLLLAVNSIVFAQEPPGQDLQGQDLPKLAVVEFDVNVNTSKANRDSVTVRNLVESQLVATGKYQVITRTDIDKLLANQQIQVSSISSPGSIRKLQLQNISYIVTGTVDVMDNDYLITVKLLDVSTGQFGNSAHAFMGSASRNLYNGVTQLVNSFTSGMTSQGGQMAQTSTAGGGGTYKIGDAGPGGGVVFYVEENFGMEVSRLLGDYNWSQAINAAKNYRGGGCSDWYLPTSSELNLIYENLHRAGLVNIGSDWYWSSSEYSSNVAWNQRFSDGLQDNYYKGNVYHVRAVRVFDF